MSGCSVAFVDHIDIAVDVQLHSPEALCVGKRAKPGPGKPKGTKDDVRTIEFKCEVVATAEEFKSANHMDWKARTIKKCFPKEIDLRQDAATGHWVRVCTTTPGKRRLCTVRTRVMLTPV